MRPAESLEERDFVENFLCKEIEAAGHTPEPDRYGNVWVTVLDNGNPPVTMFSSHTDTVHHDSGPQKLTYDNVKFHLFVADTKKSSCLGADDGTGIWLMLHMLENNVPGIYAFHREEECGGGGSNFGAANRKTELAHVKHCVAFDRKGYSDIITHQGGTQTCSNAFADALAKHLPGFAACDGGSFTDSKNYRGIIPECTNLSVGYFAQHTSAEHQDVKFAVRLANLLCKVPWATLPAERVPVIQSYTKPTYTAPANTGWWNTGTPAPNPLSQADLLHWVKQHPISAAFLLHGLGVDAHDLFDAEYETQRAHPAMVVQRTQSVRKVPSGRKEKVSRQTTGASTVAAVGAGTGTTQSS